MANSNYWEKRINETAQRRFDITYDQMQKDIKAIYDKATKEIVKQVESMYYKLLDEELSRTEIWTYKHYKGLLASMNESMSKLGLKEVNIINGNLEEALREIYKEVPLPKPISFSVLDEVRVQEIIARAWSEKHFKATCWDNKSKLVNVLKKGITDCIVKGQSKDELVKVVMQKMSVGFSNADMVVRTELMHTINAGQIQKYKDNGYEKLEILVAEDERLCKLCGGKNGKIVDVDSTEVPPFHPRCRCTVIPILN